MSRYIDIEPVIAWIYEAHWQTSKIKSVICRMQTAPSIEICFCKDCKFSEVIQNDSSGVMARYCRAFTVPMMKSDDDFCSYGEREGE